MPVIFQPGSTSPTQKEGIDFKFQTNTGRVDVMKILYQETGTDVAGRKLVWERSETPTPPVSSECIWETDVFNSAILRNSNSSMRLDKDSGLGHITHSTLPRGYLFDPDSNYVFTGTLYGVNNVPVAVFTLTAVYSDYSSVKLRLSLVEFYFPEGYPYDCEWFCNYWNNGSPFNIVIPSGGIVFQRLYPVAGCPPQ